MRKKLSCVMDIGEQMLVCGAEVHRVEDSVARMCKSIGAKRVDVFIITSSMVVTALAFASLAAGFILNVDMVIVGNIMVLIPGIGITSAMRDLFVGDNIAGLLQMIEAVLLGLAIAAGYFLFVWMIGGVLL